MITSRITVAMLLLLAAPCFVSAQSQHAMNQEAGRDAAAADKDLNAVYKKVLAAQQDDEGKALLKAAQLAWLAYRDAEAKFSADEMRGGAGRRLRCFIPAR